MTKIQTSKKRMLLVSVMLLMVFVVSGCEEFAKDEEFYDVKVSPEKLREIEILELEPMADANEVVDVNKVRVGRVELSIEQCRAMTLTNNLDLKVQLIEPTIAAQQVGEEEARFESSFFTNLDYRDIQQPTVLIEQAEQYKSGTVDLGVDIPLKTGATVRFDLADERINRSYSYPDPIDPNITRSDNIVSYTPSATLSISQPLLRGAGRRVNTYSIRIMEYQRQITEALTKLEVIRVLANTDRGYWRLYAARRELEVRQQEY